MEGTILLLTRLGVPANVSTPLDHWPGLAVRASDTSIHSLPNEDQARYLWALTQASIASQYFLRAAFNSSLIRSAVIPSLGKALA